MARKWINKDNSAACVVGATRVRPKEATEGGSAELDWFAVGCFTIDRKKCIGLWDVSILRRKASQSGVRTSKRGCDGSGVPPQGVLATTR